MAKDDMIHGDEIPLEIQADLDPDLLQEFLVDAKDHLDHIEQGILALEQNADDHEVLHTIFRAFHTFKGNAGFLDLTPVSQLAHVLESLLDEAREGRLRIDSTVIEIILKGRDTLKLFLDEIDEQFTGRKVRQAVVIPTEELKRSIRVIIEQIPSGDTAIVQAPETEVKTTNFEIPAVPEVACAAIIPESVVSEPAPVPNTNSNKEQLEQAVKVSTSKLDTLVNLAGELLIAQSLIVQNLSAPDLCRETLTRNLAQVNRVSKDLQRTAMAMRMIPIRGIFQKMHRLMRDVATRQGKDVQLVLEGEDTEIDRTIVEKLNDPLMHMVRNAVDHAIETPSHRTASGKPAMGTLCLRAYHKSGHIVIEVEDDGAGLNRDRIFEKAVRNGLLSPDAKPEERELFGLIFAPGFSTAQTITDISGRGVGLDVVQKNINKLRGRVDIRSTLGKGTTFTIQLPLTLAIIDGLLVRVGSQRYILPTVSVRESFHPKSCQIITLPGRGDMVHMREELIPLLRLRDHFQLSYGESETTGIMVVIENDGEKRCLLADELIGKQEVVIKNLGEVFKTDPMISGGAILGDGCVGLILDPGALVNLASDLTSPLAAAA